MRSKLLNRSYNKPLREQNIYADKSSVILDWLLRVGIEKEHFSIRQVAREIHVSLGLVQRVASVLVLQGFLRVNGIRTAKTFTLQKPTLLLESWLGHYNIIKKCKMWTYQSGLNRIELLESLKHSKLHSKIALALHSATEAHRCKNTNLQTLELYLLDPTIRSNLERSLHLEPQERGYEILLIEPYYKSLLQTRCNAPAKDLPASPPLLTYLDLYHFPLRGREQAEYMAKRIGELKQIYKKKH